MTDRIDQLLDEILKFRRERDWEKFHAPGNLATSISIEAVELLEHYQWQIKDDGITSQAREKIAEEIAGIFIYLLLFVARSRYRSCRSSHKEI